jgi:Bacitracin resistance protein BacA
MKSTGVILACNSANRPEGLLRSRLGYRPQGRYERRPRSHLECWVRVAMTWFEAIVLGVVQGLTEFLPVSSSGHLRIVSAVLFDRDAGASFTAVTQLGTEAAVLIFFIKDIGRLIRAWLAESWASAQRRAGSWGGLGQR